LRVSLGSRAAFSIRALRLAFHGRRIVILPRREEAALVGWEQLLVWLVPRVMIHGDDEPNSVR
jgi:hypothetical protein